MFKRSIAGKRDFLLISLIVLAVLSACGCSGSGGVGGHTGAGSGAIRINVNWPGNPDGNRYIPENTNSIEAAVYRDDLETVVGSDVITYGQNTMVIEDIPSGSKVVQVRALDESGNILSQRRESVMINNGQTEVSGDLTLGVALVEDESGFALEPSVIHVAKDDEVYFQNWTENNAIIHPKELLADAAEPALQLAGAGYQDMWNFSHGIISAGKNLENDIEINGQVFEKKGRISIGREITGFLTPSASIDNKTLLNGHWGAFEVIVEDFNNDGYIDIAGTAERDSSGGAAGNYVVIHMNDGTGTFTRSVLYTTNYRGRYLVSGDFNNDGFKDIAVGMRRTYSSGGHYSNRVNVFMNTGASGLTGNFSSTDGSGRFTYEAYDYLIQSMTCADYNQDGFDDLAVGFGRSTTGEVDDEGWISVFMNKGETSPVNGPFDSSTQYRFDYQQLYRGSYDNLGSGDFNGDGYPDIAMGSTGDPFTGGRSNSVTIFINKWPGRNVTERAQDGPFCSILNDGSNEGGMFLVNTEKYSCRGLTVADIDADGFADIAVSNNFTDQNASANDRALSVLINRYEDAGNPGPNTNPFDDTPGLGLFTCYVPQYLNGSPQLADLNNDRFPELFVVSFCDDSSCAYGTGNKMSILVNTQDSSAPYDDVHGIINLTTLPGPSGAAAGDFNNDGKVDVAATNTQNGSSFTNTIQLFLQE